MIHLLARAHATALASLAVTTLAFPVYAQDLSDLPPALEDKFAAAEKTCAEFENGTFSVALGAVQRTDLDGDLQPDWAFDEAGFGCSSAAALFCGSGGCLSHFLVGDSLSSILNQGWDMTQIGPFRVLLVDVHGSQCGGINPTPCIAASVWDASEKQWHSAAAEWEK
ncbi:hypothetical protein ACSBLW_18350 [Thioclava sp. FR2]|uniref:hypothetical protein n=1 Tax=Thioclava sp. FR2 TaxID=3445780 RepID=UPI003EBB7CA2